MNSPDRFTDTSAAFTTPWWRELSRYHWWVLLVASLGWLFDTMDQRIFVLSRSAAIAHLCELDPQNPSQSSTLTWYSGWATSALMLGWATGGLIFGIVGDRWGRARTMLLTILIYSIFTGLSAFAVGFGDFVLYQFLKGMGVGGEFAAGVAFVAEVMPERARPHALGLLQALSAVGNIVGSGLSFFLSARQFDLAAIGLNRTLYGWQLLFLVGAAPALAVVLVRRRLKDPESWQQAKAAAKSGLQAEMGDLRELLGTPRWRRNTIIGLTLALAGVIGLWGVGFWTPELISFALRDESGALQTQTRAVGTLLQDVGAFFGVFAFTVMAARIGRRPAFAISFVLALAVTLFVFNTLTTRSQVYWMLPLLGFSTLTVFGGYAIYFPELYPTRLRSTGTGVCYNVGRVIAAVGPFTTGGLTVAYQAAGINDPFRAACSTVALIFLLGLVVLPFAPETKDQPLPE
jgi:MFS family permease